MRGGVTRVGKTTLVPFQEKAGPASADRMQAALHGWGETPFGPSSGWPSALATVAQFLMASDIPMTLYWGSERRILFNDAAVPGFGPVAPAQGDPGEVVWGDWWPRIAAQFAAVETSGRSITLLDEAFTATDGPRIREVYWNLTFWPIADQDGKIAGILCAARDTTDEVFAKRLDRLLVELDEFLGHAASFEEATDFALRLIAKQLNAPRAGFGEVDAALTTVDIRHLWSTDAMPDIRGRYPLGTFGPITPSLQRGETAVIDDALADPRLSTPELQARYAAIRLRSGLVVPILDRGRYVGGIFVQDSDAREWTPFEIAIAEAATQRLWSAITRLRTDAALRSSEQRYRLIFEQAEDIIFAADVDQRITDANQAGARAIGLSREDLMGKSISDFVSADGFAQTTAMLHHKLEHGGNTRHEVAVVSADGRHMLWENNSTLILDPDKRPIGLLSISRDVTERRAFDERRELLIHELNHRVKNTLSLVQGLAHQSFRDGQEPRAAAADFAARLSALATAHDLLTRDQWEGATIAELVRGATAHAGERIAIEGPHLLVSPKSAVALVMAMHELTTNAVKYGALSVPHGRVSLRWDAQPESRFEVRWQERGGPRVVRPNKHGFGVRMIEKALASDLGGVVRIDFAETGVVCTINGPVQS